MAMPNNPDREFRDEVATQTEDRADTGIIGQSADVQTAGADVTFTSHSGHASAADQIARVAAATRNKAVAQQTSDRRTSPQSKMGNQPPANPPRR